jgi:proteic killer suppression protein
MIRSFRCKDTEALFGGNCPQRFRPFQRQAERKLQMLEAAESLQDLRSPPGNRLEKLVGDRPEQYSIRMNDRWRICFEWIDGAAADVEIMDYHR